MKKVFITIFMFLPFMGYAQTVLTPQQQLEQAQKQLEEAKKAVEAAQKKKAEAEAKQKKAEQQQKKTLEETDKIQQQIKEAQAEAARLQKEADKLNNETAKQNNAQQQPLSNGKGWYIPTAEAKKTETKPATLTQNGVKLKDDPKYLEGAVTLDEDGRVSFEMETECGGKSADQIYQIVYAYMNKLTQDENSKNSRVALVNPQEHIIANTMDEWLVFSKSFISLDRTECKYSLVATIKDNYLKLTMNRIIFAYEQERSTGFKEPAENIITDKFALNKKKTGLAKIFGKFRRKTIDRKDQIFNEITELVK